MIRILKRTKNQKVWKTSCKYCLSILVIEREDWERSHGSHVDTARCPHCAHYIYLEDCTSLREHELLG